MALHHYRRQLAGGGNHSHAAVLEGKGGACDACLKQHQFDKALEVPCNQHEHVKWKDNVLGYCGSISDEESAVAITYEALDATYYEG